MIKPSSPFQVSSLKSNNGSGDHSQEERSSLLNDSDPNQNEQEKPLQFENIGDQYEELQKKADLIEQVDQRSELKKTINNLMSQLDAPADDLNKSDIQELDYQEAGIQGENNISIDLEEQKDKQVDEV